MALQMTKHAEVRQRQRGFRADDLGLIEECGTATSDGILMRKKDGKGRVAAIEILLNTPLISDLILKGEVHEIKAVMEKSNELGMKTFDQALFDLYEDGQITYEDALRNADSVNELRLRIKLEGAEAKGTDLRDTVDHLSLEEEENKGQFVR